jgi:hypothetical protein
VFNFPSSVHDFITKAKKAPCRKAMYDDNCQEGAWFRLCEIQKTEYESGQSYSTDTSPVPFSQAMVKRVGGSAYQPTPTNPTRPLCYYRQEEAAEK